MSVSFFIAGDVVPKGVYPDHLSNHFESIFREVKPYINDSNFSFVNLEAPVVLGNKTPIKKSGPCLSTTESTIEVLKAVGFDVITLANNHFYDQGQQGVDDTLKSCEKLNLKVVGGGHSYNDARTPLILNCNNKLIGVINACEHEFSIANSDHGGSNPLDLIDMHNDIIQVKKKVDYIVLIIHGGVEMYKYPTPRMKRWYRYFIDLGADAIINHHQHCINGFEVYKGRPIFYGIGNFYFPYGAPRPDSWDYGYAVKLNLAEQISFELIPYKQTAEIISLRNKSEFKKEIDILNFSIEDDCMLQQAFDRYLLERGNYFKSQFLPSFFSGKVVKRMAVNGLLGSMYKGKQLYSIKNKLTCESHNESLRRLFEIYSNY